ncbi:MAG: hypothetical protein K2L15_04015, partial [Eubacteriales bacterium]|nr:hypothetical protein [Eubacteriales bacterium]
EKNRVLKINEYEIKKIVITNNAGKTFHISKYAKELLNALQEDIKNNVDKEKGKLLYDIELFSVEGEYGHNISRGYIYDSYTNTLNLIKEKTNFVDEEPKLENIEDLSLHIGSNSFRIDDKDDIQYVLERSKPREKEMHSNDSIWFKVYYNDERQTTKR